MKFEFRHWKYVIFWTAFIYVSIPIARPVLNFLKDTIPFELLAAIAFVILPIATLAILYFKIGLKQRDSYIRLGGTLILYCLVLLLCHYPEEKIHLLEYSFLYFFAHGAYCRSGITVKVPKNAFIVCALLSTLDEVIQYFHPDRVFDVRDILINCCGVFLGLLLVAIIRREKPDFIGI